MKPIKLGPYSPKTANATEFNASGLTSTGAAMVPTTTATSDGLAHQVTLVAPVQPTLAGVTFTITGTDADGNPQTETGLVGPASGATVTSTKYFKTVTSILPSVTMGALVVSVGMAAPSLSPSFGLADKPTQASLSLVVTGTINATVRDTIADGYNPTGTSSYPSTLPYTAITALSAKTADTDGQARMAARRVQILTNSVTNGATCSLWVGQAG